MTILKSIIRLSSHAFDFLFFSLFGWFVWLNAVGPLQYGTNEAPFWCGVVMVLLGFLMQCEAGSYADHMIDEFLWLFGWKVLDGDNIKVQESDGPIDKDQPSLQSALDVLFADIKNKRLRERKLRKIYNYRLKYSGRGTVDA